MSEEDKKPIKKLQWFSDLVENLPKRKGDSLADKVVDIESAKLVRAAGEEAISTIHREPEPSGLEKGISKGLETAAVTTITEKFTKPDPIRQKVDEALGDWVGGLIKKGISGSEGQSEAEKELARIHQQEYLDDLFQKFHEKVVAPLKAQVDTLVTEKEKATGKAMTTDEAVEMVMGAKDRYIKFLESQGLKVESVQVTKEQVTKMIEEEKAKNEELLRSEKEKWEKEAGVTVQIETERIRATENILNGAIDRVFDVFLAPIKGKIEEAIEKGAFKAPGA